MYIITKKVGKIMYTIIKMLCTHNITYTKMFTLNKNNCWGNFTIIN